MAGINRPNDLMMGADPQAAGAQPPVQGNLPRGGPPGQGGGMNPGGMQLVKAGIQQLLKMGLDKEQIVEAILKLAAKSGMDIPEEEIRALIQQTGASGGAASPQTPAGAPQGGQAPPVELPAGL